MSAITPSLNATTANITLATLQQLVRNGQQRHPDLAGRMAKAAMIVALRTIRPDGDGWLVESESEDGKFYFVSDRACTCPDFSRAPRGFCKHKLATILLGRCVEVEATRRPAPVVPFPTVATVDPDARIPYALTAKALAYLDRSPVPAA